MIAFAGPDADGLLRVPLAYRDARAAVLDPRGVIVRSTPTRVTRMQHVSTGQGDIVLFCKVRVGSVATAEVEWRWLRELNERGFNVSRPAFFARAGERTVVATFAVQGRPLPALLVEAGAAAALAYADAMIAPLVRRLHQERLVFRDLYWQHLIAGTLATPRNFVLRAAPTFIDVERVMRPRWRWRRWLVKDLAGLVATWPFPASRQQAAASLVTAYRGAADGALATSVLAKAERIAAHVPRFGA